MLEEWCLSSWLKAIFYSFQIKGMSNNKPASMRGWHCWGGFTMQFNFFPRNEPMILIEAKISSLGITTYFSWTLQWNTWIILFTAGYYIIFNWQDKARWVQTAVQEVSSKYREILFHCESDWSLAQVAKRGFRVSILGDIQKPSMVLGNLL